MHDQTGENLSSFPAQQMKDIKINSFHWKMSLHTNLCVPSAIPIKHFKNEDVDVLGDIFLIRSQKRRTSVENKYEIEEGVPGQNPEEV